MDSNNLIPHLVVHVSEGLVSQDPRIVDKNIDASVCVNCSFNNSVSILSRHFNTHGFSAAFLNFLNHVIRIDEVIDDYRGAQFREKETVRTPKSTAISTVTILLKD